MPEKYDVIITAGGRISGEFAVYCGTEIKGLIKINGETIISRVVKAFRESEHTGEIILVGPEELKNMDCSENVDKILPEGKSGVENILIGLNSLGEKEKVILCSSDIPLITASDIDEFIKLCPRPSSICYPIFEKSCYLRVLPGTRSDFVRLKNSYYTGGSIFLIDSRIFRAQKENIEKLFDGRKNSLAMVGVLGINFIFKFFFNLLDVTDIERRISKMTNAKAVAIIGASPRLACDIDTLEDYQAVMKYLQG